MSNFDGLPWVSLPGWSSEASTAPALVGGCFALTFGLSSSCWIAPGTESPSTGSEFWSPAITNREPGRIPPYRPSSS